MHKLERGETIELPDLTPMASYGSLGSGQRHDRCRTPQARPPSSTSSRRMKRRDTAMMHDTVMTRTDTSSTQHSLNDSALIHMAGGVPDIKVIRVRQSRPVLSTVVSSGSKELESSPRRPSSSDENTLPARPSPIHYETSTKSSESLPYRTCHRAPLSNSDVSSLNCLQDLVSPQALLTSRFVSAPLVEAKIRLPPSTEDMSSGPINRHETWTGGGLDVARAWADESSEQEDDHRPMHAPFDYAGRDRDPTLRWSVDF